MGARQDTRRMAAAHELAAHITPTDLELLVAEKCARSLHAFFRHFAWPALNPGVPYADNWHVGAICEHLEAVHRGQIRRLIINMPFRMLKTTLCSVAFPAWEWLSRPELHFLTSSYAIKLSTRDAVDSRRIIESNAYRRVYGHRFHLVGDQNEKTRYENDKRGQRVITSTDSAGTGFGGNRIIVDDPISAREALSSETAVQASIDWWKGTGVTRLNDPERDAIIVVHQRLSTRDLSGYLLAEEPGQWDHLVLPMRYEREHTKTTSIGWKDPRTVEGELMHPGRLGEKAVASLEQTMGAYHGAAQLQQRPDPKGGTMFKVEKIGIVDAAPATGVRWVRGWDFAASTARTTAQTTTQAYTAGVKIGFHEQSGQWFVGHSVRERFEPDGVESLLVQTAAVDGQPVEIDFPQDPGQAGKSQAVYFAKKLAGYSVSYSPESGEKAVRATPFSSQVNAGNVFLVRGAWNQDYLDELKGFPGAAIKDQVDASARAFNHITGIDADTGFFDYVKQRVDEMAAQQQLDQVAAAAVETPVDGFAAFVAAQARRH